MMVTTHRTNGRSQPLDLMELFNTITTFIMFNMLWLFGALLIVTIPAVTAALFAVVAPWARAQSPQRTLASFFAAVRRYWFKATAVALIDLAVAGFIFLNFLILGQMGVGRIMSILGLTVTVLLAVVLILSNVYLWPLLVMFGQPLPELLRNAIKLAVIHPYWGAFEALTAIIPIVLSIFLPRAFFLTVTFAAAVLIANWGAWRVSFVTISTKSKSKTWEYNYEPA